MTEYIRSIEVTVVVDTNKRTETFTAVGETVSNALSSVELYVRESGILDG